MIYIIHFDEKLSHSQHYVGFCEDGNLLSRFATHKSSGGARILRACNMQGINYKIVRVIEGDRNYERLLKNRRNHKRLCPICNPKLESELFNLDNYER